MKKLYSLLLLVLGVSLLPGCSSEEYKEQADTEVYQIIEEKWAAEFGPRVNLRINDVAAGPNDIIFSSLNIDPNHPKLRLCDAVQLSIVKNRNYQSQKESLFLQVLGLTGQRHAFATQLFGIFSGSYQHNSADESVGAGGQLGFSQLLADGAQVSTSIATNWLRYLTGDPRTSLTSVLSATVRQPLLRGAGRNIVQENLNQSERDSLYQMRSFARYRKSFVVDVISRYYRVLQSNDTLVNTQNNYRNLLLAEERLSMMADAGRIPRFELQQAQQSTLQARDSYQQSLKSYEKNLDDFKFFLGLPPQTPLTLDPNELMALQQLDIADPNFDVADSMETALDMRLDVKNVYDAVEDARRKIDVAENALQAELNVSGSLNTHSGDGTEFHRLEFNDGTYGLGLELDLPFDRKIERNAYRRALISHMRAQRSYDEYLDQVRLDVRQAYRELGRTAASYQIQRVSLKLAEKRVESTSMLVEAGDAITRDLLEAQDDLLAAQNRRTDALVSFYIAKLNFARDIGVLQVQPDGSWYEQAAVAPEASSDDAPDTAMLSSEQGPQAQEQQEL